MHQRCAAILIQFYELKGKSAFLERATLMTVANTNNNNEPLKRMKFQKRRSAP
jgi:hypothetical protein